MRMLCGRALAIGGCLALVIFAVVVVWWANRPSAAIPAFVAEVAPSHAQRVYSHPCCSRAKAFEIYYGTSDPFDATLAHYRQELEARGYWESTSARANAESGSGYWFENGLQGQGECLVLAEFRGAEDTITRNPPEIVRLRGYPYAYVVQYRQYCGT